MLEVHDLAFGFPGRTVGRGVSFRLERSEEHTSELQS